jgi:hypothetical protein
VGGLLVRIWKFPDQVIRLGAVFGTATVALLFVRQKFVPESFGALGHFRAEAIDVAAAQGVRYAGWQACVECHGEEGEKKAASYHRTVACEVCHGPAADHASDHTRHRPFVPKKREACLYCHSFQRSRPTGFPQIIERLHNPTKPCASCHNPHDPTPPQTPGECSACHGQIERMKSLSHHAQLSCETCHETPAVHKTVPRANPPKKPTDRQFCARCHAEDAKRQPGIETNPPRIDPEVHGGAYLCWQCHYPHSPVGR